MTDEFAPEVWRAAGYLFHELVDVAPAERPARLQALANDAAVRAAVARLLEGDASAAERLPLSGFGLREPSEMPEDPLRIGGTTVVHFAVEAYVAEGGMGVVYRARDLRLGRRVALKFLPPLRLVDDSAREHFLAEARAAGALDHPNLCPLFEIGESHVGPFLVMPWYDGETLRARLSSGPVPLAYVLAIGEQLAAGLASAHAAGIVHRDIKPGNVMLAASGDVKLLDFGLAKLPSSPADVRDAMGTRAYMAPERRHGVAADAQGDLWALGAVLFEMATGATPAPAGFSDIDGLPTEFADLLRTLLAEDPAARGPAAAEVAVRLASIARASDAKRRVALEHRERRLHAAAFAAAFVVLLGAWPAIYGPPWQGAAAAADARLVLADMAVVGADSALASFSTSVIREHLTRSKRVTLVTRSRVDSLRRRMRVEPERAFDAELARAVAQREGAAAVIASDLVARGDSYLLTARIADATSGEELAVVHARALHGDRELIEALARMGRDLRQRIGESRRALRAEPALPQLTTRSVDALQAMLAARRLAPTDARAAAVQLRRAVEADSTFAYAHLVIANGLNVPMARSAARDSALARMYRYRHDLSLMEISQVTGFYWWHLGLDRHRAIRAFEGALAADSLQIRAAGNLTDLMLEIRDFARAERLVGQFSRYDSVPTALSTRPQVRALLGQGRVSAADSVRLASVARAVSFAGSVTDRLLQFEIAQATLRYDDALAVAPGPMARSAIARVQGRLRESARLLDSADAELAAIFRDNLVEYRTRYRRAVTDAEATLWIAQQPDRAIAQLDWLFAEHPPRDLHETQDRLDALRAAATYAAAGRPDRARALVAAAVPPVRDTLVWRAVHARRHEALGEIALAEGRPREALEHFRRSDRGADGLPATRCAVCVVPRLARAHERAGMLDSARAAWERYVSEPALDRLPADQWFLHLAYRRLAALCATAGDHEAAARYAERAEALRARADSDIRIIANAKH